MARIDVAGIAEPHLSTVAAIVWAAGQGLFTAAEAELLIDRVRIHATTSRVSIEDSLLSTAGGTPATLSISPERPVS